MTRYGTYREREYSTRSFTVLIPLKDIDYKKARQLAEVLYTLAPQGEGTLTVRNGKRALLTALLNAKRLDKVRGDEATKGNELARQPLIADHADSGSEDNAGLLRRHAEPRLPVRRPRPSRPARPAARLPQDGRQRAQRGADHRRDPRPVRHRGTPGRRRRPHDRALQGHRLAAGDLPRLALARGRSEGPRTLGRSGARRAQGGLEVHARLPGLPRPRHPKG